jgi:hypothetical protein
MRAQAAKSHRTLKLGPSLDRQPPNQHEAATRQHLVQDPLKARRERGQRKVLLAQRDQLPLGVFQPFDSALDRAFDLGDFGVREGLDPIAMRIQLRTVPCGRPLDFGGYSLMSIHGMPESMAAPVTVPAQSSSSGVATKEARAGAIFGYLPMRAGFPVSYTTALDSSRAEEFAVEHAGPIYAAAFSRDSTLLATVGGDSIYVSACSAKR